MTLSSLGRMLLGLMALTIAMPVAAQVATQEVTVPAGTRATLAASVQIMKGMEDSAEGWNRGDLDRFLAIYSDDPATSFAGSNAVAYGKAGIRAKYLKTYAGQFGEGRDPAGMSTLSFVRESFRLIGKDHALLVARWKLVKPNGETAQGMTSLLFRKEGAGWRIIADHSS